MADDRTRFQTYLYKDSDADIIEFWENLRRTDKRMVLCAALRMFMTQTGYYQRNNTITPQSVASPGNAAKAKNDKKIKDSMLGFANSFGDVED